MLDVSAGFSFYFEVPGEPSNNHIWTVVTDPDSTNEEVAIVNFTSVKEDKPVYDDTTIVEPSEFSSVLCKRSYLYYFHSRVLTVANLNKILQSEFAAKREFCPPDLCIRIQEGIIASKQTPAKVKKFVRASLRCEQEIH